MKTSRKGAEPGLVFKVARACCRNDNLGRTGFSRPVPEAQLSRQGKGPTVMWWVPWEAASEMEFRQQGVY